MLLHADCPGNFPRQSEKRRRDLHEILALMLNPPFRSPRDRVAGLCHFGRLLDKIRLHQLGRLPEEYQPNFGLGVGLDGQLCGFLGIGFDALCERVRQGGSDEEIAEWCFAQGLRPNKVQKRIWNEFARKLGWNDYASGFVAKVRDEDGMADRAEIVTSFDLIDLREGRQREPARDV